MSRAGLFTITCFLIAVSSQAYARLGDSYEQCVKRYGSPQRPPPAFGIPDPENRVHFEVNGTKVVCDFENRKCERMVYSPARQAHVEGLLEANKQGAEWGQGNQVELGGGRRPTPGIIWDRTDGARAIYQELPGLFPIMEFLSPQYMAKKRQKQEGLNPERRPDESQKNPFVE